MRTKIISLLSCLSLFISSVPVYAAVFNIRSGDVTGLIAAITAANANGEENTINLEPGTYTLRSVDNALGASQANGLPVISSRMVIRGESAETTIIERDTVAPTFRILFVLGTLEIDGITIRGGQNISSECAGGGINNFGTLAIHRSTIEQNLCLGVGGGISNSGILELSRTHVRHNSARVGGWGIRNSGKANIIDSNIAHNLGDGVGAFWNSGTATIRNSTIQGNSGAAPYSGIYNEGAMTISNTTIANNYQVLFSGDGSAIFGARGTVDVINSTISRNRSRDRGDATVAGAGITMQNTIVAQNTLDTFPVVMPVVPLRDCPTTSLGHNLFGNPSGCSAPLHPTDLTGDPGLGTFVDSGAPGSGRFPLLPSSQAIDAGNEAACAATDQLDTPRRGRCDIGAVEFYPVINDLVAAGDVRTEFDATPVPNGPAGTFRVSAEFTNTSNQAITSPFVEVVDLSGGNLLLNADGGSGGIGARLRPTDVTILQPGTTNTYEFLIGLQRQEPFTFFVNMLGESLSDPSIRTIRVNALIDGRSQLILRGNTTQWRHFDFAAPGRLDFKNVPTIVNKMEWFPTWPDQPDRENRDCDGCLSDVFTGVNPSLTSENTIVSLRKIQARNNVSIVQLPTADNNFTLIIEFDDNPPSGDDTYIVDIDFVTDQQHGMKEMAAR